MTKIYKIKHTGKIYDKLLEKRLKNNDYEGVLNAGYYSIFKLKDESYPLYEKMAKANRAPLKQAGASSRRDSLFDEVELALSEHLGRKVRVLNKGENGVLQIEFYGKDDLQALANRVATSE